jgi:hypothetical protein
LFPNNCKGKIGQYNETPSEYYVRKTKLLRLVSKLTDSELIMEIMNGAPAYWHTVIDAHRCADAVEFQSAIKYHQESLSHPPFTSGDGMERRIRSLENTLQSKPRFDPRGSSDRTFRDARSHLVGWTSKLGPPKYPKDDSNVSTRATPESKGARPCKHCGSSKHWDNECKHARSAAHTHLVHSSNEEDNAYVAYEDLYLEAIHESEHEFDPDPAHVNSVNMETEAEFEQPQEKFQETPQSSEAHCQLSKLSMSLFESKSQLGGSSNAD